MVALKHFICEPYILLMYIDSSSTLKLGRLSLSRICNETSTNDAVYICRVFGVAYAYIHLAWAVCVAYSFRRAAKALSGG